MEVTIDELRELIATKEVSRVIKAEDVLKGRYVICRCFSAGVHAGRLVQQDGDVVLLENSRRLWSWKAKSGVALSGVAQNGLAPGCKVDTKNPFIRLTGVIETIPCTTKAEETIENA